MQRNGIWNFQVNTFYQWRVQWRCEGLFLKCDWEGAAPKNFCLKVYRSELQGKECVPKRIFIPTAGARIFEIPWTLVRTMKRDIENKRYDIHVQNLQTFEITRLLPPSHPIWSHPPISYVEFEWRPDKRIWDRMDPLEWNAKRIGDSLRRNGGSAESWLPKITLRARRERITSSSYHPRRTTG